MSGIGSRLRRVETAIGEQQPRPGCRQCKGMDLGEILEQIASELPPESIEVLESIMDQIEEFGQRPLCELPGSELEEECHGFLWWLRAVQAGYSSVPERVPHELLLAWKNGHANHPARATSMPIRRCEDCLLMLPNCTADGFGPCLALCPACRSATISHKKLSGNEVDGWDPMWVYTPLPDAQ